MKAYFLGQGLSNSNRSVGDILIESLSCKKFNKCIIFVAFASSSGVNGLSGHIKKVKKCMADFKIFVGIDQKGTSKEALQSLLKLKIDTKIYYTTSHVIFHPKIYLFESNDYCRIIIGSSNLTKPGLFQNIESSLLIEFNKPDKDGIKLLNQIYDYFELFLNGADNNIKPLTKELIKVLYKAKIIPNEKDRRKIQEKNEFPVRETNKNTAESIKNLFPYIKIQKTPSGFNKSKKRIKIRTATGALHSVMGRGPLLWKKSNLPASDVQYMTPGTNPTGGLRLTQADWVVNNKKIDQTTYFRNVLFKNFRWQIVRLTPKVEMTKVLFNINVLGNDIGIHRLGIRHKPSGEAGQKNYTTLLSWGRLGDIIHDNNLKNKTIFLYGPRQGQNEPFYIEIR